MDANVDLIYRIARIIAGDADAVGKIAAADGPEVVAVLQRHCIGPLLYDALKKSDQLNTLPAEMISALERESRAVAAHNMLLLHAHARIARAAAAAGLPLMPLKGIRYIESIYSPEQRPLTDVDYLIRSEHRLEFKALMQNLGYTLRENAITREFEEAYSGEYHFMSETGGSVADVEMHYELIPMLTLRAAYPLNPERLWMHATIKNGISIPRIEHDVLFVAVHLAAVHCFSRLIWLADIDRLVRAAEKFDWDFLWDEARAARAGRLLAAVLRATQRFFSTPLNSGDMTEISSSISARVPREFNTPVKSKDRVSREFPRLAARSPRRISGARVDSWIAGSAGALEIGMVPFLLSDNPARHILGQLFPSPRFVRLRYNVPAWRVPFFYAARPFALAKNALAARRFDKVDTH